MARRLLTLLLPLVVVATSFLAPPAAQATGLTPWAATTGAATSTVETVNDGAGSAAAEFTYVDHSLPTAPVQWQFQTTAASAGPISLEYAWTGFHSYFEATAQLETFVTTSGGTTYATLFSAGPADCGACLPPSAGFTYCGPATFNVQPGDVYGFRLSGQHFDSSQLLQGDFVVDTSVTCPDFSINPAATSYTVGQDTQTQITVNVGDVGPIRPVGFNTEPGAPTGTLNVTPVGPGAPTAVINPQSVNAGGSTTITLTTTGATVPGMYTIPLSARSGGQMHSVDITITVEAGTATPTPAGDTAQPDPLVMTVNTADDHTDGLCGVADCTLREAIESAHSNGALGSGQAYTIGFATATHVHLHTPLPPIDVATHIDGTTSLGPQCPGNGVTPVVEISPASPFVVGDGQSNAGLTFTGPGASDSSVKGLVIDGFPGDGLSVGKAGTSFSGFTATCNVIGPNLGAGIRLADVAPAVIGADLAHGGTAGDYNVIATNSGDGIAFTMTNGNSSGDRFDGNLISDNGGLGIDLNDDGVTANHPVEPYIGGANLTTNAPHMLRAEGGPDGGIAGTLTTAYGPGSSSDVTFYLAANCDPTGFGEGDTIIGTASVQPDANGYVPFALSLAGLPTTGFVTATTTDSNGGTSEFSNCVPLGAGNDSWPNAQDISTLTSITGSLNYSGQARWYKFAITPGSQVSLDLTNLPADYDLLLFKDISQTYAGLTSTSDLTQATAEYSGKSQQFSGKSQQFSDAIFSGKSQQFSGKGQQFSGDLGFAGDAFAGKSQQFSGIDFSGKSQQFSPIVNSGKSQQFSPAAYTSAQARSLVGFSLNTGLAPESISDNTWNNTGYYYVRVSGNSGAFASGVPFTLHRAQSGNVCQGVLDYASEPLPTPTATGVKTVILTDPTRIVGTPAEKAALAAKIQALAARPEVAGAIVDVGQIARIADLNAQADGPKVGCPYAKNLVAMALRDVVDSYRTTANPDLAYVVIVGGDGTIPFFRYPDTADLAPESGYIPPVMPGSASDASLQLNYVLSQDAYGAARQLSLGVGAFPVPSLAVGRLVETASEASGVIDAYLNGTSNGVVPTPTSSLSTGYDFMADAADSVAASFAAGIGSGAGTKNDTLIAPNGIQPTDPASWTADRLRTAILGSRHDLIFLAGHFNSSSALAADFTTEMSSTELASSTVNLVNSIVFSQGCHSGYNLFDADGIANVSQTLDWAQAFARKQATLIAGTGYQYGDTDLVAYSEAIYAGFSKQLLAGSGPVSVGQALVRAKQAYLATTPTLEAIDAKALLEATLFGLPMLSVDLQHGRTTAATDTSIANPAPLAGGTGPDLGLQHATVNIPVSGLVRHTKALTGADGAGDQTATWYTGPDGTVTKPFEPALPLISRNVSVGGQVLRGVGFRGGAYTDEAGIVPLSGAAATEVNSAHTAFTSPTFYPIPVARANYFDALGGGQTRLLITPVQHRSEGPATVTSTLRKFSDVDFELFYSSETGPVAGTSAPSILDVSATDDGAGGVDFRVRVAGDPAAGIRETWVTYTFGGQWTSLDLVADTSDPALWTGHLGLGTGNAADLRFIAQSVNGVGLVALDTRAGAFYQLPSAPSTAIPNATSLHLGASNATSGVYGSTASLTAHLSGAVPIAGQPVALSLGTTTYTVLTDGSGDVHATFPLSDAAGTYAVSASFPGDNANGASVDSGSFTIHKASTSLVLAGPSSGAQGAVTGVSATLVDTSNAGAPIGQRSVVFVVSDPGNAANAFSRAAITSPAGVATLGAIPLPAGNYIVNAYFGGNATLLPSNTVLALTDDAFASASDSRAYQVQSAAPAFTFDLAALPAKTFGNAPFNVGSYAATNSGGAITFTLGSGSTGCTVTSAGQVTLTGAALGAQSCVISASLAPAGTFTGAGPLTSSFHVAKGSRTISISNLPASPLVNDTFIPTYATSGGGTTSTTSTTTGICTVSGAGLVTFVAAGTCTLTAAVTTDADYVAATGNPQSFSVSKRSQSIAFSSTAPSAAVYGDAYTPATSSTSGLAVTLGASGACALASGKVTMTTSGTCTLTANQAGNGVYVPASQVTQVFTVGKKPATLAYTGVPSVSSGAGTTASVTLTGTVTPAAGGTVSTANATVDFLLFHAGNFTGTPDDHCLATASAAGAVSCTKTLGLDDWTVVMTIPSGNAYFTAAPSTPAVVAVIQTANKSVTGAGTVADPSTNNAPVKVAAAPANRGAFGFAVSYKTGTTTPQGMAVYTFRGIDGYHYWFTTSGWTGGSLVLSSGKASFTSKCSVTAINPTTLKPVSGIGGTGFTCKWDVTDGSPDKLALTVTTSTGALYHQVGTPAAQVTLATGGITVKS